MRFVWITRGTSPREIVEAKAVVVEADDLEAAKKKVANYLVECREPEDEEQAKGALQDELESYGSAWLIQELSEETL